MVYRKELDGLRAVAVLSVLLFHAGFSVFSGGYLGVDVFFVISGYLITSIVLDATRRGVFSFSTFYSRRVRRLLPALFFVTLATFPFVWNLMLPSELYGYAKSVIAVAVCSANIFFWKDSGYFSVANDYKPLIHTWTLGLEEQFYLLFPAALVFIQRSRFLSMSNVLIAVGVLSFIVATWADRHSPVAGFYLLPARTWEFCAGALVAINIKAITKSRPLIAALGLGLIVTSVVVFSGAMPDQRSVTFVSVLGASLYILFSSADVGVGKLLSVAPIRYLGLCSYSVYLVHQPVFALTRLRFGDNLPVPWRVTLIVGVLVVAVIIYEIIEKRFRSDRNIRAAPAYLVILGALLILVVFGLATIGARGFPLRKDRKGTSLLVIDDELRTNYGLSIDCDGKFPLSEECHTSADPDLLVWGDSFAMQVVPGLVARFPDIRMVQYTKGGCAPVIGADVLPNQFIRGEGNCVAFNSHVDDVIKANPHLKYAIISSPFTDFFDGKRTVLFSGVALKGRARIAALRSALEATASHLRALGIVPIIISPPPNDGSDLGECLRIKELFGGDLADCDFPERAIEGRQQQVFSFLHSLEAQIPVVVLSDYSCGNGVCHASIGGTFLYRDNEHLSYAGSRVLFSRIAFPPVALFQ